jgi:hypothetical protein
MTRPIALLFALTMVLAIASLGLLFPVQAARAGQSLAIDATPNTATNLVNTDHTITANVTFAGAPQQGATVTFNISAGPNTTVGAPPTATTDINGDATFMYTGSGGAGTDTIDVCTEDIPFRLAQRPALQAPVCDTVTKTWVDPTPTPSPAPSPTPTLVADTATPTASPTAAPVSLPGTGGDGGSSSTKPWAAMALLTLLVVTCLAGTAAVLRRAR